MPSKSLNIAHLFDIYDRIFNVIVCFTPLHLANHSFNKTLSVDQKGGKKRKTDVFEYLRLLQKLNLSCV